VKAKASSAVSGAQPTLLKVDIQKFKAPVQTFTNFVDFGKASISGEQPFLITNFCILQDFLKDNVALKCQLVNFGNQFLETQICKQTGVPSVRSWEMMRRRKWEPSLTESPEAPTICPCLLPEQKQRAKS